MNESGRGKMTGAELIAQERKRQIDVEGYLAKHDDHHEHGELLAAAKCYIEECEPFYVLAGTSPVNTTTMPNGWPWDDESWKPSADPIRNLVKAGALIAAEIDRLQRADS